MIGRFTREDLSLDRRGAARTIVGVVVGSALLEPLERWLWGTEKQALIRQASGVGEQEVEQIENASRLFRNWDDQFGGGLR
ncbi:MAG TPA: hypothetical protein VGR21_06450, partial [Cryptosporangiaceae bacterium]|nr:hypothetical protein [Cryptosporangiaceae bacterium]